MTFLYPILIFLAATGPLTLDQVRADPNPEHRAKAAVDYAAIAERAAESASDSGDTARLRSIELVQRDADRASHAFQPRTTS